MRPHDLQLPTDPEAFAAAQLRLAAAVSATPPAAAPRLWGAVDVGYNITGPDTAHAVAVLMDAETGELVEEAIWQGPPPHGYVPGLFSLREGACLVAALERLSQAPDVLFIDGHGIAHPRGFGLACQMGLTFDVPTVGVAKRRLCGEHGTPGDSPGDWSPLRLEGRTVGGVLRTQAGVKPVFVSPGHRCDVETAIAWSTAARSAHRLLAPIRYADIRTRQVRDGRTGPI